ncbi:MAG: glycoside hydrolase family 2 protein [Bacilli bacterium]|jgi:beta-galactosidase|nr:glycoside hydrolase family 2 protein [Bacilli bacterium]
MRKITPIDQNWNFIKKTLPLEEASKEKGIEINLPHTWNNKDGQDGGNNYVRGKFWYLHSFAYHLKEGNELWLEVEAASQKAEVYINGELVGSHEGGYSAFRVNLTPFVKDENLLAISVDNSPSDSIYPQSADFTFYGGLTRHVLLIEVPSSHFALDHFADFGFKAVPFLKDGEWYIELSSSITNIRNDEKVNVTIANQEGNAIYEIALAPGEKRNIHASSPHLWNGLEDPYLYQIQADLVQKEKTLDSVSFKIGFRSFSFDKEKGFFLNGKAYPLRGVAKHQDFKDKGSAVSDADLRLDMSLIQEVGANIVRLSHYQHSQLFYDLADENGLIIWTEVPCISIPLENGLANWESQLTELICQCQEHPSIICWGLSNEITLSGEKKGQVKDHQILNDLAHQLDPTRPTTMAHISSLSIDSSLIKVPDLSAYNLYFGWYVGMTSQLGPWLDNFHKTNPDIYLGLSEYGADANPLYHSLTPQAGDYTESYELKLHYEALKTIQERPYLWMTSVWNMFDFGADSRMEGGNPGFNQKGLVTADRKLKKDAFYIYKAFWSKEPFVHLTERRYVERVEKEETIQVISNLPFVELSLNGEKPLRQEGKYLFPFQVSLKEGKNIIKATSGIYSDQIEVNLVIDNQGKYICKATNDLVSNWFEKKDDVSAPEGMFSILDQVKDVMKSKEALMAFMKLFPMGSNGGMGDKPKSNQMFDDNIMTMIGGKTVENLLYMMAGQNKNINEKTVKQFNQILNTIPKPKK